MFFYDDSALISHSSKGAMLNKLWYERSTGLKAFLLVLGCDRKGRAISTAFHSALILCIYSGLDWPLERYIGNFTFSDSFCLKDFWNFKIILSHLSPFPYRPLSAGIHEGGPMTH